MMSPALPLRPYPLQSRWRSVHPSFTNSSLHSNERRPMKYAVLGAGFAGISVAFHLLKLSSRDSCICVDIYDEVGIGGGASGVAGGLLHPYSPKAKVLWRGAQCWKECLSLIATAERVAKERTSNSIAFESSSNFKEPIVWRRGILRPATEKNLDILKENAQNCLASCSLQLLDENTAQDLVPDLHLAYKFALYMPFGMNIHPKRYLEALLSACYILADETSVSECTQKEINFYKRPIGSLVELAGTYDNVIVCLGAKVNNLTELSGKLPLRTCRGVVAELHLPASVSGEHGEKSPSILSDAWLAFQGPRSVFMGSTWDWRSEDYTSVVSSEEASRGLDELLPKASAVYPGIKKWEFVGAKAGVRAMPPKSSLGSVPLLGCVNDAVKERGHSNYWLFSGLGSRGLLYHGLLGKLMAQAVLACDENILPPQLTSWKHSKSWGRISQLGTTSL